MNKIEQTNNTKDVWIQFLMLFDIDGRIKNFFLQPDLTRHDCSLYAEPSQDLRGRFYAQNEETKNAKPNL